MILEKIATLFLLSIFLAPGGRIFLWARSRHPHHTTDAYNFVRKHAAICGKIRYPRQIPERSGSTKDSVEHFVTYGARDVHLFNRPGGRS